jgi:hypothetical protein
MPYLFTRTLAGLAPLNDDARDWLMRKKQGAIIRGDFAEPRNGKRMAKYWAIIDALYAALSEKEGFATREHLHDALKVSMGFFDYVQLPGKQRWPRPKSIAFENMREPEFVTYMDKFVELVRFNLLGRIEDPEARKRVEDLVE